MKKLIFAILFLAILPLASAQLITIGVMPSKVELNFFKAKSYKLELFLWNSKGEVDAMFELKPDECIKDMIESYPKEVLVKKNTTIFNPVKVNITFKPDYSGNKTCFIYVFARPKEANETPGGVSILPSVGIKLTIAQPKSSSYYNNASVPPVINLVPNLPNYLNQTQPIGNFTLGERTEEISGEYEEKELGEKENKEGGIPIWYVPVIACAGIGCAFIAWKIVERIIYEV